MAGHCRIKTLFDIPPMPESALGNLQVKGIGQLQPAENPPSTYKVCPVIKADAFEARKIAVPTMSSGCPSRPSGALA
jgi:hypothetical protein